MHESLPVDSCPWVWRDGREDIVVCHGDPCALGTADRWSDLAVCSMSLDWNFGEGWQPLFFEAYGIAPDADRIRHYRALWNDEP